MLLHNAECEQLSAEVCRREWAGGTPGADKLAGQEVQYLAVPC